jgi:hypothetical protein
MSEEPEDEFYEDFGSQPPSENEVDEMVVRARAVGDVALRRTLKYHLALRHVSDTLLRRVEESGEESEEYIKLARFIIRGEGGIGSNRPALERPWWKFW